MDPTHQPRQPHRVSRRRAEQYDVAAGAAEIQERLKRLGVDGESGQGGGRRGHPRKRLRILVAEWGALATREVDHSLDDRILPVAHRAAENPRPDHASPHLARRHHEDVLLVRLGAAQHLRQLNVHRNGTRPRSPDPPRREHGA